MYICLVEGDQRAPVIYKRVVVWDTHFFFYFLNKQ